jgi:hypothetical protein
MDNRKHAARYAITTPANMLLNKGIDDASTANLAPPCKKASRTVRWMTQLYTPFFSNHTRFSFFLNPCFPQLFSSKTRVFVSPAKTESDHFFPPKLSSTNLVGLSGQNGYCPLPV